MTGSVRVWTSRRYTAWLVAALLVVWCASAFTPAIAASSASAASPATLELTCEGPVPYYTAAQVTATRSFLIAFTDNMYPVTSLWSCSNFCTWDFVTCTAAGVEVDLADQGVLGALPAMPSGVTGSDVMVTKLDFSDNIGLGETLPPSWYALSRLQHFSIAATNVGGSLPASWAALTSLVFADFSESQVTATVPASWSALTNLQVFRAYGADIDGSLPASWTAMSSLTEFDMHSCSLSGTLPNDWRTLTTLTTLRVNGNSLNGSIPEVYGEMSSLATVALEDNSFCGCLPSAWTSAAATVSVTADAAVTAPTCATLNSCTPVASSSSSSHISSSSSSSSSHPTPTPPPTPTPTLTPTPASSSSSSHVPHSSSSSSSLPIPPPPSSSSSSSSSFDACNAAVPYYSEAQVTATQTVLAALRVGFTSLTSAWTCSNYCTWSGIACDEEGVRVSLSNTNLVGTLPVVPAVSSTDDVMLTYLDLSYNPQLTGTLPGGWLLLPRLIVLNISNCGIGGELPEW